MELALIRSLMDKSFYDSHRGAKCPDRLFSKDARKIKQTIDKAMSRYERTVTPDEIEALFMSNNPTLTTAQKQAYSHLFRQVKNEKPMGEDVAQEVLSKLFQQVVGEDIANIGFDYVNGSHSSLEPIRNILEVYGDDFTPNLNVEWDDMEIDTLLAKNDLEARWSFNVPSLTRQVEGINAGHLIEIGARPNTGKTSFHSSIIAGPDGLARQGASCIMGDKFARTGGFARTDEALKANAVHARMIAKEHKCAVFYMSQLSADAEGKVLLNQSMMEGSRTGKAAEADLMILIAKNPPRQEDTEEDLQRHLNVVKNKLTGWHGVVHCNLNYRVGRYEA